MMGMSPFMCGWMVGTVMVLIWFLYGEDVLPQLKRSVIKVLVRIPWFEHFMKSRTLRKASRRPTNGASAGQRLTFLNNIAGDRRLEGLTGSTQRSTSITASARCVMGWYGADGSISAPMECRLMLEKDIVTVYQVLHSTAWSSGTVPHSLSDGIYGLGNDSTADRGSRSKSKDGRHDSKATSRKTAGSTVLERCRGDVCLRNTTVMEVKQFNSKKTTAAYAGQPSHRVGDHSPTGTASGAGSSGGSGGSDKKFDKPSSKYWSSSRLRSVFRRIRFVRGGTERMDKRDDAVDSWMGPQTESSRGQLSDTASEAATTSSCDAPTSFFTAAGMTADSLFTGRVLIWRTVDGRSLFDSSTPQDPLPGSGAYNSTVPDRHRSSPPLAASHPRRRDVAHPQDDHTSSTGSTGCSFSTFTENDDCAECASAGSVVNPAAPGNHQSHRHRRDLPQSTTGDTSRWSCVIIKFERARDSERWHTLLSGFNEAQSWHCYAKTLPNPDTINTLLSRFFFQNMTFDGLSAALIRLIRKKLRELPGKKFPRDLGGDIILDEFLIGTQIPWISDVSEPTVSTNGEVSFDLNLLYKGGEGGFILFFRLALTYRGIRIPHIIFSVKLLELEATLHVSIGPPPSKKFWVGAHKPPVLQLEVHQGCASGKGILHHILRSLPDLSGIATNLLKLYLFSDMVLPYMEDFPLPSVVKSPKNSFADLRVRAFDWQRAAKISSAPERGSFAERRQEEDSHTEIDRRKGKAGRGEDVDHGGRSAAATGGRADAPAASVPYIGGHGLEGGTAATASKFSWQSSLPHGRSLRREGQADLSVSLPVYTSRDECSHDGCTEGTFDTSASNSTFLPVGLASLTRRKSTQAARDAATALPGQTECNGRGSAVTLPSTPQPSLSDACGASSRSIEVAGLVTDDMLSCEGSAQGETNGVGNGGCRGGSGKSSGIRNMRDLLKVKGRDMFRESVSRSKKKN